jgi:signal transduction histidine kinase
MNLIKTAFHFTFHRLLPGAVLIVLVIYTYAKFYEHAYVGFRANSHGNIILLFTEDGGREGLRIGDRLIQVDSIRWDEFQSDLRKRLFARVQPGQVLSLLIEREGKEMPLTWRVPASSLEELRDLLFSEGWLGFFFWIAGTFTLLALRPADERWYLLVAFEYLTALWLVIGSGVSFHHIWDSAVLIRIIIWFCVPVYLHLHWVFPQPLGKLPNILVGSMYGVAGLLAIAEWFQVLPPNLYSAGFLLAVAGSCVLLLLHPVLQPTTRRDLRFLTAISLTAMFPAIVGGLIAESLPNQYQLLASYISGGGALLGLPLIPFAYLYSIYRRQLGKLEIRVNNFFSVYVFVLLIVALEVPLSLWADQRLHFDGKPILIGILASMFTVMAGAWIYPALQQLIEHRLLGIPLTSKRLLETFSTRITTSISLPDLVHVLREEVFPSLLIRQFAFLQYDQGFLNTISTMAIATEQLPTEQDVPSLMARSGVYRAPDLQAADQPYSWIRLVLALQLGNQLLGFWLLGRRDPDDHYSPQEIPTLSSLANLTAIALSNILQTARLKAMYESNIDRYEQERLRLAHDLHDSILNELAAMMIRSDVPVFSPAFQQAFDELTERLREIVNDLRPPMLVFGLKLALEDFAENLRERNQNVVEIVTDFQADAECRYPNSVENNLYRIVQEACENSIRYAHAKNLTISGKFHSSELEIKVEDDGIGLKPGIRLQLNDLLASKHFGLAGMHERAHLTGAELIITSRPGEGTQIDIQWKAR